MASEWMIYGANGFTGRLVAEHAVKSGMRPVLAGRSGSQIEQLASQLALPFRVFDLSKSDNVKKGLEGIRALLHCAGPYVFTAEPMMRACIGAGAHYLDITGEISAFKLAHSLSQAAADAEVLLMPGTGFDVVPTDCLARFVSARLPGAEALDIAFAAVNSPSPGTARSMVESLPAGTLTRENGVLKPVPPGTGGREFTFMDGTRYCIPVAWGDLETAYHTTGINTISTYMAFPRGLANVMRYSGGLLQRLFKVDSVRRAAGGVAHALARGPAHNEQLSGRSAVYACARRAGEEKEAWLETMEAYAFTARSSVRAVELALEAGLRGFYTPARAFGEDFVLQIEGTIRKES